MQYDPLLSNWLHDLISIFLALPLIYSNSSSIVWDFHYPAKISLSRDNRIIEVIMP